MFFFCFVCLFVIIEAHFVLIIDTFSEFNVPIKKADQTWKNYIYTKTNYKILLVKIDCR